MATITSVARRTAAKWRQRDREIPESVPAFLRYIARHAAGPLGRALGLLLLASASESLSLLLIVPIIGLLTPGQAAITLKLPLVLERFVGNAHLSLSLVTCLVAFVILVVARAQLVRVK